MKGNGMRVSGVVRVRGRGRGMGEGVNIGVVGFGVRWRGSGENGGR